jgi:hypothetical protein
MEAHQRRTLQLTGEALIWLSLLFCPSPEPTDKQRTLARSPGCSLRDFASGNFALLFSKKDFISQS